MTASSNCCVVHLLGISWWWIYREPTLMLSYRPNLFTNWCKLVDLLLKENKCPGTDRTALKAPYVQGRKCGWLYVFGFAWRNIQQTLKNGWRTQPLSFSTQKKREQTVPQIARGKHSSNSVRAKAADQRESCLQFRPTRQFFPRVPGERAQREINLRYQFAEFCSIDGRGPRDFTPSTQEPQPVNNIT